jgi:hypothetical protein
MMNHPDTTYLVVKSLQATREREAEDYRLTRQRPTFADSGLPAAPALRCRLLSLVGGKEHARALSLIHAQRLFADCQ